MKALNTNKVVNCIFSISLAFAPYLYLFLVCCIFPVDFPLGTGSIKRIFLPYFIVVAMICIPNVVFACASLKSHVSPTQLAFWSMFIKLLHIPFYLATFILAATLSIGLFLFGGPIIAAVLVFMFYLFLLTSSALGICALKQAQKQGIFDSQFVRRYTSYLYIFGMDIVSAVMLYRKLSQMAIEE